jgi:hypothetical protein
MESREILWRDYNAKLAQESDAQRTRILEVIHAKQSS